MSHTGKGFQDSKYKGQESGVDMGRSWNRKEGSVAGGVRKQERV